MFELQFGIHLLQAQVLRLQLFQSALVVVLLRFSLIFPFVKRRRTDLVFGAQGFNRLFALEVTVQDGLTLACAKSTFSHG